MAPIHPPIMISAWLFNFFNGVQIGGWLGGYGITDNKDWAGGRVRVQVGLMLFALGMFWNILHDDELREIRRVALKEQAEKQHQQDEVDAKKKVERVYKVPENLAFRFILYPHYVCEWFEWLGYWIIGGSTFTPGRSFVFALLATMTPQAIAGKKWYIERFGKERIGNRKALIPFIGP